MRMHAMHLLCSQQPDVHNSRFFFSINFHSRLEHRTRLCLARSKDELKYHRRKIQLKLKIYGTVEIRSNDHRVVYDFGE